MQPATPTSFWTLRRGLSLETECFTKGDRFSCPYASTSQRTLESLWLLGPETLNIGYLDPLGLQGCAYISVASARGDKAGGDNIMA